MIHAAAVERGGCAAILPAPPGSGKSTLCAALVHRGWRLLTDELTLLHCQTKKIVPLARPVSLKNNSIQLMRNFAPQAVFGPAIHNTIKGTIAYMRPPAESVGQVDKPAMPKWVIFPKYNAGAPTTIQSLLRSQTFTRIADSLVNYTVLGESGFETLSSFIEGTDSYEFKYSNLDEAVAWFDGLMSLDVNNRNQERYANSV